MNTDESFSSEGEKEDTFTNTCHPDLKACDEGSSISHGVKGQQRVHSPEKCSEDPGGPALCGQSSSSTEEQQRHTHEKAKISRLHGNATVDQCNNTGEKPFSCPGRETAASHKRNTKSHQRTQEDECDDEDQNLESKQSTSLATEAEETKRSAPCQTVCKNTSFCRNSVYNNRLSLKFYSEIFRHNNKAKGKGLVKFYFSITSFPRGVKKYQKIIN